VRFRVRYVTDVLSTYLPVHTWYYWFYSFSVIILFALQFFSHHTVGPTDFQRRKSYQFENLSHAKLTMTILNATNSVFLSKSNTRSTGNPRQPTNQVSESPQSPLQESFPKLIYNHPCYNIFFGFLFVLTETGQTSLQLQEYK